MKTRTLLIALGVFAMAAMAQYSIGWSTIDGGGGTSTGGDYTLSGTIGQPDAGEPMTGGSYSLTGGFWVIAIQVPGAPYLTIVPAGPGHVTISWMPDAPGWLLQETTDFTPTNWVDSTTGSTNPVSILTTNAAMFYRLRQE